MISVINTFIEWYSLGHSYNESINFRLDSTSFTGKDGTLGITERTDKFPTFLIGLYSFTFIFLLVRVCILFYMNSLLFGNEKTIINVNEFKDNASFFYDLFLACFVVLGLLCLINGVSLMFGDKMSLLIIFALLIDMITSGMIAYTVDKISSC